MNKCISYSVWGNNPKYTIGAIKNAQLANIIYPEWISCFYIGDDVPNNIIFQLKQINNVKIITKNNLPNNWTGMFWRFEAGMDNDITIFRDADSRLSLREKYAVDEWLKSDKTFHIMRDHPYHKFPILGGMWGFKNNGRYNLKYLIDTFEPSDSYGTDYTFLSNIVYPLINDDKIVHDPFYDRIDFPTPRDNKEFVGDVFDQYDNRHPEYYKYV